MNLIINGSFEEPIISEYKFVDVEDIQGWETTSSKQVIELQHSDLPDSGPSIDITQTLQFVELNARSADTVYQTIDHQPNRQLYWSFVYKARNTSPSVIESFEFEINGNLIGTYIGTGEWIQYRGIYTPDTNATEALISLKSISPISSKGNLIDEVYVSHEPWPIYNQDPAGNCSDTPNATASNTTIDITIDPTDPEEINKINSDWEFTEHFYDVHPNEEFRSGYEEVQDGTWEYQDRPTNNSNFWGLLKEGFEPTSQEVYERISNYVQNTRDIDYCTIFALKSIASELDIKISSYIDYNFPKAIRNLIDILSVNRTLLLHEGKMLTDECLTRVYDIVGELPDLVNMGENEEFMVGYESCPVDYKITNKDELADYMDMVFEKQIRHILTQAGNVKDELEDPRPLLILLETLGEEDSDTIQDLKIQYGIPISFSVKGAAKDVISGETKLSSYTPLEIELIRTELSTRISTPLLNGSTNSDFVYDKLATISRYVKLIDDINTNNETRDATSENGIGTSSITVSDLIDTTLDLEGKTFMDRVIEDTAKVLRNICMDISYTREYLKMAAQRHTRIGTGNIVSEVIKEYIYRNFTPNSVWSKHTFETGVDYTSLLGTTPEDRPAGSLLEPPKELIDSLNILEAAEVSIQEYFDTTEYLNIREPNEDTESTSNPRFWEGTELDIAKELSEHTELEFLEFYSNLGWGDNFQEIEDRLSHIYDIHSTQTYNTPDLYTSKEIPESGKFGTYGTWTYDPLTETLEVRLDEPEQFGYTETLAYSDWQASGILDDVNLLEAWEANSNLTNWQEDPLVISGTNLEDTTPAKTWIDDNFKAYSWATNDSTVQWIISPILNSLYNIETFGEVWDYHYSVNSDDETATLQWMVDYNRYVENWNDLYNNPIIRNYFDIELGLYDDVTDPLNPIRTEPTQAQWDAAPFITDLLALIPLIPYDRVEDPGADYNSREDWKNSPFVAYFTEEPYIYGQLNITEETVYGKVSVLNKLLDIEAIASLEELDDDVSYFTGESLIDLNSKYTSDAGIHNYKNTNHATIAPIPFIWNLIAAKNTMDACISDIGVFNFGSESDIEARHNITVYEDGSGNGSTNNLSLSDFHTFVGYRSEYQVSDNTSEESQIYNRNIDIQGPWNTFALKEFVSGDHIQFIDDVRTGASEYYSHVELTDNNREKIASQLEYYTQAIRDLKDFKIYRYFKDIYGNHYTLFKDTNNFSTPGKIWFRFAGHAMSFPIVPYDTSLPLYDNQSFIQSPIGFENVSQMNFNLSNVSKFLLVANKAYDMDILDDGTLIAFGADCDQDNVPSINGYVSVVSPITTDDINDPTSTIEGIQLIISSNPNTSYEGHEIDLNSKYVGFYKVGTKLAILNIQNPDYYNKFLAEYIVQGAAGIVPSFAIEANDGFEYILETTIYNTLTGTEKNYFSTLTSPVDETTFTYSEVQSGIFHNNWKLSHDQFSISLAHEIDLSALDYGTNLVDGIEKISLVLSNDESYHHSGIETFDFPITTRSLVPTQNSLTPVRQYVKYGSGLYNTMNPDFGLEVVDGNEVHHSWSAIGLDTIETIPLSSLYGANTTFITGDGCLAEDLEVKVSLEPMYADAVVNGTVVDYTIGSYMEQLDANTLTDWNRYYHNGSSQFVFNSPSDISLIGTEVVNRVDSTPGIDNIIITETGTGAFLMVSDRFTKDFIYSTYIESTNNPGIAGTVLGVYEDYGDMVLDSDKGEYFPRTHTISVVADYTLIQPVLKIVYDLGQTSEQTLQVIDQEQIDYIASTQLDPALNLTYANSEKMLEVQRRGCKIQIRYGNGRNRENLQYTMLVDINELGLSSNVTKALIDWNHIGIISSNITDTNFEIESQLVYDALGINIYDKASSLIIASTMLYVTTDISGADSNNDLFDHNLVSDDPYYNIVGDEDSQNITGS